MQAQRLRTQTKHITATQSLATVQTLLKAGLGCIAFLRNLLPEDNFTESHFITEEHESFESSVDSLSTSSSSSNRGKMDGFKIITMTRGYTDEADKLLDYLELGIFDALEKQYLRSFVFAIYLDKQDPNNIIEAYTFNFQYHKISGTETVVPLVSLGKDFQSLSLHNKTVHNDPVAEAIRKGDTPTLKDVKKSIKVLLKTLIHVMSQMDDLPKRRYATFKLLYTDNTPADYEPPCFKPGDFNQDRWYFMTHDMDEVPDRWGFGKLRTGYHSVNLSVTSISTYLPSSAEHDRTIYVEDVPGGAPTAALSGIQEAKLRSREAEIQTLDAECRNIVWLAEPDIEIYDEDAEGEVDPEYVQQADGRFERIITAEESSADYSPIGIRNTNGDIEPITIPNIQESEDQFHGVSETVPTCLKEIAGQKITKEFIIEETQLLTTTAQETFCSSQLTNDDRICTSHKSHNPTSIFRNIPETQINDSEMIDLETQVEPYTEDSIQSFASHPSSVPADLTLTQAKVAVCTKKNDKGLQCECGVMMKGDSCFCEGDCGRWYHVWCMGFHSVHDTRIPAKFMCFDCRVRGDISWELVKMDIYPKMIAKFKELALFRRAIKIAEMKRPATIAEFSRSFGGDQALARQLINRLETEGFVSQMTALEDLGHGHKSTRRKPKGVKSTNTRNYMQKRRYAFNQSSKMSARYMDYFNPDPQTENQLLCLSNLLPKSYRRQILSEVSTSNDVGIQKPTGVPVREPGNSANLKRSANALDFNDNGIDKKVKISVATGVDLAE
ncbi:HORMA domain-containing protein [Cyathus striatus]|nr:HORMA domain-containing protein [Cyathus striatus]